VSSFRHPGGIASKYLLDSLAFVFDFFSLYEAQANMKGANNQMFGILPETKTIHFGESI